MSWQDSKELKSVKGFELYKGIKLESGGGGELCGCLLCLHKAFGELNLGRLVPGSVRRGGRGRGDARVRSSAPSPAHSSPAQSPPLPPPAAAPPSSVTPPPVSR